MRMMSLFCNNCLRLIVASLLAGTFSLSAHGTETGWYIGFAGGESDIVNPERLDDLCAEAGIECADGNTDTAFKILAGYQANNFVSLEGAYFDLGQPSLSADFPVPGQATATVTGGSFSVLPQIPVGSIGFLYGKLGLAVGDIEVAAEATDFGLQASASATGGTLLVGLGGAINLGRNVSVRVEWERYAFDETLKLANIDVETPDIDVFSGVLVIRFPRSR